MTEEQRLAGLLRGLGVEVREAGGVLDCRTPGHPAVPARLARLGVDVRPGTGDRWVVAVRGRDESDRLVQAVWSLVAAF